MPRAARTASALARVLLALGAGLWALPAVAGGAAGPAGYHAVESCPGEARWHSALAARASEQEAGALARQLRVEITRSAPGYRGSVTAVGSGDTAREVRGQSCVEVLEALALIAVLMRPSSAVEPGSSAGSPASLAEGWTLARAQQLALAEVAAPAPAAPPAAAHLRWGITAFTWLGSPTLPRPSLVYGFGLHGEWAGSVWQPSLRLAVYTADAQRVRAPGGAAEARFRHAAVAAAGCPWRYPSAGTLAVRPCLTLDVGRLTGEGIGVAGARQRSWPWLSTGTELRLEWAPLPSLQLGALLAAVVPLNHPRFYFLPELTSFQVPMLGFRAGVGLSSFF